MDNILEVRNLKVRFPVKKGVFARTSGYVEAVNGVSFDLRRGETLGVVGESGSGKSTLARVVIGLQKPSEGEVRLSSASGGAPKVAMVFQDPLGSLNPRRTVRAMLEEIGADPLERLTEVGLDESALDKYPHEFSGGQRQRICIARAIALGPELLICDEAVSALDLSIRSQILDLLAELKRRLSLSVLFITHDLGVVKHVADSIIVMHNGRIVESGSAADVLASPKEDYTKALLAAVPRIDRRT